MSLFRSHGPRGPALPVPGVRQDLLPADPPGGPEDPRFKCVFFGFFGLTAHRGERSPGRRAGLPFLPSRKSSSAWRPTGRRERREAEHPRVPTADARPLARRTEHRP